MKNRMSSFHRLIVRVAIKVRLTSPTLIMAYIFFILANIFHRNYCHLKE